VLALTSIQKGNKVKNKPTRAQSMAEQYGTRLEEISGVKLEPHQAKHVEIETVEMRTKRRLAVKKLATFRDLLG
jgi:hypothetical protein